MPQYADPGLPLPNQQRVDACEKFLDPPGLEEKITQIDARPLRHLCGHSRRKQEDDRNEQTGDLPVRQYLVARPVEQSNIYGHRTHRWICCAIGDRARLVDMLNADACTLKRFAQARRQTLVPLRN